jgi:hypothetical protein
VNDHIDTSGKAAMGIGAAGGLTVWGLQLNEWGAVVSMLVAVIGLAVHIWATLEKNRRHKEEHAARMAQLTSPGK